MLIVTGNKKYEINFVFQPICSRSNKILFVECLTRINDVKLNIEDFFASINDNVKLKIMMAQVELLRKNQCFFERRNLVATVNVSFKNMDVLYGDSIRKDIARLGFINLELNEFTSQLLCSDALKRLNEYYKNLWLDDFGVGLSNFNLIYEKNFKYIKIDRFMFWNLFKSEEGKSMLNQLVKYLTYEGYLVVIEGIESEIHFEWFKKTTSFAGQGFFWPEMSIDELKKINSDVI